MIAEKKPIENRGRKEVQAKKVKLVNQKREREGPRPLKWMDSRDSRAPKSKDVAKKLEEEQDPGQWTCVGKKKCQGEDSERTQKLKKKFSSPTLNTGRPEADQDRRICAK